MNKFRKADLGWQKFSQMVVLQGPQNCEIIALKRPKFVQKRHFYQNFLNVFGAATDFYAYCIFKEEFVENGSIMETSKSKTDSFSSPSSFGATPDQS